MVKRACQQTALGQNVKRPPDQKIFSWVFVNPFLRRVFGRRYQPITLPRLRARATFLFLFVSSCLVLLYRSIVRDSHLEVPMSSLYPFPTNVFRVFQSSDIEVLKRDECDTPAALCLTTHTVGDRAIALVLLQESPDSFVLSEGARYFSNGTVHPCDPARPASLTELRRAFDVETVEIVWPGPRLRAHIFTHTLQEWEDARAAVRHLVDQQLLSPLSSIEGDHTGEDQGLFAQNLDAIPHSAGLVALVREAAYCVQNDLYEKDAYDEEEVWQDEWDEQEENGDDDVWEDEWNDSVEEEEEDTWEDDGAQQDSRENLDEELADGATAGSEENGTFVGTLAPLHRHAQIWCSCMLNWWQALQRSAPWIVVCQRCHTRCETGVERAEQLCSFHLYTCELGTQMEAAQEQLVALLARRVTFLQSQTNSPSR